MNKKFLSAILFGALMVTSTGTFVSCKDYDDDISNLQIQIDKNSSAIAELQKLVGSGNWVTNISPVAGGFTVTMSNGQSQTITGINGADGKDGQDGKNGTEWTIGEDGFWYMDGEKTDNVAVGKNGENGVTAPSPQIVDGYWVVYNWDAEKGEFVAETTEIPAAGTAAYAVEANGIVTLHIADANGEYMEVVLPATSDSFVVEALAEEVNVEFETAAWKVMTAAQKKSNAGKALLAKFPEIANIKKDTEMKQGGKLPLIVTPANVDLTDGFHFHLQDIYGKFADIELSAPVKGAGNLAWEDGVLESRTAEEACLWSLEVTPAYNEEDGSYASTNDKSSLVVENAKGTAVRTAFAYTVEEQDYSAENKKATIAVDETQIPYAKSIDLFATFKDADNKKHTPIKFEREYHDKYVIELVDEVQAETYGIEIAEDGHTLTISNLPASKKSISVGLNIYVLSLNGIPVALEDASFTIGQDATVTETLAEKEVTLKVNADGTYTQFVLWAIPEDMTATKLNQIVPDATTKAYVANYINALGEEDQVKGTWAAYKADGKTPATTYKDAAYFGFVLDGKDFAPADYTIRLTASTISTNYYVAEAALTVKNPVFETAPFALVEAYLVDGVLQVAGTPKDGSIKYALKDAFAINDDIVTAVNFVDVAHAAYIEEGGVAEDDLTAMASVDWIGTMNVNGDNVPALVVNKYDADDTTAPAKTKQIGTQRTIRAEYAMFGNDENIATLEFDVIVKSAVYSATPAEVVTFTAAALTIPAADDVLTDDVTENQVDLRAITTAKYAFGPLAGTTYKLWNDDAVEGSTTNYTYSYYSIYETLGTSTDKTYLKGDDGLMITIADTDLAMFGYSGKQIIAIQNKAEDAPDKYIRADVNHTAYDATDAPIKKWSDILAVVEGSGVLTEVVKKDKTDEVYVTIGDDKKVVYELNTEKYNAYLKDANNSTYNKECLQLFNKYKDEVKYTYTGIDSVTIGDAAATGRSTNLTQAGYVEAENPTLAAKFVEITEQANELGSLITVFDTSQMTSDEVSLKFFLVVEDAWGMTMKVPFVVTIEK